MLTGSGRDTRTTMGLEELIVISTLAADGKAYQ